MKQAGHDFSRPKAESFVDALSEAMTEGLKKDRKLTLSNFGTFTVSRFGAKIIKSPRGDNKKFFMPPTDVIKWRPSLKVRERAKSTKVTDDIHEKLKKGQIVEELPPEAKMGRENLAPKKEKKLGKYEVKIDVFASGQRSHISDEQSPISRLTRSIINDLVNSESNRLEIKPEDRHTVLVYYHDKSADSIRTIPIVSHQIIVDKLKFLAGNINGRQIGVIRNDKDQEIKVSLGLSRFGETVTLELN